MSVEVHLRSKAALNEKLVALQTEYLSRLFDYTHSVHFVEYCFVWDEKCRQDLWMGQFRLRMERGIA